VNEPVWITEEVARAINEHQIARYGGFQAGIRDDNLFRAALARPLNKWHYEEPQPNLYDLAAAYCFAVVKGHVFHDGNKRSGHMIAAVFLERNGERHHPAEVDVVAMMVAVADGSVGEGGLARWFRDTTEKIGP
jgi:death on curing protein